MGQTVTVAEEDRLMKPAEVAGLFRVEVITVTRWANAVPPKLDTIRTPGGHRRYRETQVRSLLAATFQDTQ